MLEWFGYSVVSTQQVMAVFYCLYWFWILIFAFKVHYKYKIAAHTPITIFPVSEDGPEWMGLDYIAKDHDYFYIVLQGAMSMCFLSLIWIMSISIVVTPALLLVYTWYWFCVHWPRIYKAVQKRDEDYNVSRYS